MLKDVLIGVAIAGGVGFGGVVIRWALVSMRLPKRITRLEASVVLLLRVSMVNTDAQSAMIRSQQGHKLNGELEEMQEAVRASKAELAEFLSGAAVSQKART